MSTAPPSEAVTTRVNFVTYGFSGTAASFEQAESRKRMNMEAFLIKNKSTQYKSG